MTEAFKRAFAATFGVLTALTCWAGIALLIVAAFVVIFR